jgi:hypothetical protein
LSSTTALRSTISISAVPRCELWQKINSCMLKTHDAHISAVCCPRACSLQCAQNFA